MKTITIEEHYMSPDMSMAPAAILWKMPKGAENTWQKLLNSCLISVKKELR